MGEELGGAKPSAELNVARHWLFENARGGRECVQDRQRIGQGHDASVGVAAANAEQDHVAGSRRVDLTRRGDKEAKIALVVAMQHPVARVGARIEGRDEVEIAEHAH